jgi:DinB superfamily
MNSNVEEARRQSLSLLNTTRRATRSTLSRLDPEQVVHNDERAWRVRDVVGHLGVWNGEAARSLSAYAKGGEYFCVTANTKYYEYNGPAADERNAWTLEQVWAEYEASHDQLKLMIETMPADKWDGEMLFPWNERGTVEQFIKRMMKHEKIDHCNLILKVTQE